MTEPSGKTVLITGAASGIGRETSLAFARAGSVILNVDIDQDGMDELNGLLGAMGATHCSYTADVSDTTAVEDLAVRVIEEWGGVDILVNVAGVCLVGDIVDTPLADWEWIIGVNLWGPINTIRCFLPSMIERKTGGHIVNVASGAGLFALAGLGAYSATKFGLVGLSEALAQEVREHGIAVTVICPGGTDTPILDHMRYHGFSRENLVRVVQPILSRSTPAEKLGEIVVRSVRRDRFLVPVTLFVWFHYLLKRVSRRLFMVTTHFGRLILNKFR